MPRKYKISILPGDGIGREVIPAALNVLLAAEEKVSGFQLEPIEYECGGEYYLKTGREWSEEAETFTKEKADAVLLGAVGAVGPDGEQVRLPDKNLAGYNIVLGLRFQLDLYANVRPIKLYEGVPTPLAEKTHNDIDMIIIRENTEGLYTPARGRLEKGGETELAVDLRVITKKGARRVAKFAFEQSVARKRGAPVDDVMRVTCVDKSNLLAGCQLFRETYDEVAQDYPQVERDYAYVDAWTQWCLRKPEYYDLLVTPNEFGDIITDLGASIQGGLGMAPAGNIGEGKGVFEPVHGSAPKHAGQNKANPIAAILAGAMMLDWLGTTRKDKNIAKAGELVTQSVTDVLKEGKIRTYDICTGNWRGITPSSTETVATTIADRIRKASL